MIIQNLLDIHTHHPGRKEALLSLPPDVALQGCNTPFSLELHPWELAETNVEARPQTNLLGTGRYELQRVFSRGLEMCSNEKLFIETAQKLAGNPNLMAIGECGLDNQCGVPIDVQLSAFIIALQTARELHLPVIIHCVGYWAEMMACVKEYYPLPMGKAIIHGYRKGSQLALQLLRAGFCLSLGEKFNPEVARLIPDERLFLETDESETDILQIREKILSLRKFDLKQ